MTWLTSEGYHFCIAQVIPEIVRVTAWYVVLTEPSITYGLVFKVGQESKGMMGVSFQNLSEDRRTYGEGWELILCS